MGSNGLSPMEVLRAKDKCPDAPTKARYLDSKEAWKAAGLRTQETGIEIAAYACPGCGYFHLTKKVDGSDIVVKAGDGISTGALRKATSDFVNTMRTERRELPNETPIIPGNADARSKVLAEYLKDRDTVTGPEALAVLGIKSSSSLGRYMRELGWEVSSHGRGAYWRKSRDVLNPVVSIITATKPVIEGLMDKRDAEVEASIARHPAGKAWRDVDLKTLPPISLLELLNTYSAAGLSMRIQVSDR